MVPVSVQGTTMRLGVDTGLANILLYGDRLKKYGGKIRTEGRPRSSTLGGIKGTNVSVPGVHVGGPEEVINAILIDGPGERILPGLDGYLGVASLHARRVEFDFAKMTLRWR